MKIHYFYTLFFAFLVLGAGCSPLKNSQYQEYLSLRYEVPECNQHYTYSSITSITGTAKFFKRGVNLITAPEMENSVSVIKLKNMTQGDPLVDPLPIKFAEVAVYDNENKVIQCGKTDALGNIKALDATSNLEIPAKVANFTVRVYSRMNHALGISGTKVNLAVKQDIYKNEVYYIAATASSNGIDDTSVNLLAYARQTDSMTVEGGAFNLLNDIFLTYQYIEANTGLVDTTCLNDKFDIYWKLGFNPVQYDSPDSPPENLDSNSYYDVTKKRLFITGGKLGNFSFERADHFNDYVAIHEVGHHIENVCGSLLSPGGPHRLITRIDPRLAWSEAWSNYLAGHIMYNNIDSINPEFSTKMAAAGITNTKWTYFFAAEGFSDSVQNIGSGAGFMFDLKKAGNNPDAWQVGPYSGQPFDKTDGTQYPGEGHFREGSITRGMFKMSNVCGAGCILSSPISFSTFWSAMSYQPLPVTPVVTSLVGMGHHEAYIFKSSATFFELVKKIITNNDATPAAWTPYRAFIEPITSDALDLHTDGRYIISGANTWIRYGTPLITRTGGACTIGTMKILPRSDDPVLTGTNSDQRYSNHFFTIDFLTLTGLDEIHVTFTKNAGTDVEFDLILFSEDYLYYGDYSCPTGAAENGSCSVSYQASRNTDAFMVKSDRRSGNIATKVIRTLSTLDPQKRYLLNIRAYTANKSIAATTDYTYQIRDQNGNNICP